MKKQTALDWFIETTSKLGYVSADIAKQAKQMEKEQMENVFKEAQECAVKYYSVYFKYDSFDKLYNETYGGQDEK